MATLAALAAAATVAGAGASIYSTMSRDTSGPQRQADYGAAQLQDARNNEMYQRMVSAMVNQRSIAGSQDSWGSSVQYDPGSNTWRSQLGAEPEAADRASMQASIRQNTTQARMAELANEQAALRAARAGPAADAAQRQLADYRPMGRDDLSGTADTTRYHCCERGVYTDRAGHTAAVCTHWRERWSCVV